MIAAARETVTRVLSPIAPVSPIVPKTLPAIVLTEADPFVEPSTFDDWHVRFSALVIVRPGDPAVMVSKLDALVSQVIGTVTDSPDLADWEASAYAAVTLDNSQPVLTCRITVTTTQTKE